MNRSDLRALARLRRREARALLELNHPAGAYYLIGYAVECALKACIARGTRAHDFPEKTRVMESYTHDLSKLLRLAELDKLLDQAGKTNPALVRNWALTKDWKETSRYDATINMKDARTLYKAVTRRRAGVLAWLRQHW
jgi:HEPN domain-containing protein